MYVKKCKIRQLKIKYKNELKNIKEHKIKNIKRKYLKIRKSNEEKG